MGKRYFHLFKTVQHIRKIVENSTLADAAGMVVSWCTSQILTLRVAQENKAELGPRPAYWSYSDGVYDGEMAYKYPELASSATSSPRNPSPNPNDALAHDYAIPRLSYPLSSKC